MRVVRRIIFPLIFLANLGIILWYWWLGSGPLLSSGVASGSLIAFGRLFGLVGELLLLVQLITIGRVPILERIYGHDKMNHFHRILGYSLGIFLLFHPFLLVVGFAQSHGVGLWSTFVDFLQNREDVFAAFLALVLIVVVVILSLPATRRKFKYEHWHLAHLLMYLAIVLAFSHQTNFADFLVSRSLVLYWYILNFTVFGLVLAYRFGRPIYLYFKHRFVVDRVVAEADDVTSIYLKGNKLGDFKFHAGQFANLLFFGWRTFYDPHPFSFSHAYNGTDLRFSVKGSGDFTNRLREIVKPGTKLSVEGPLGAFVLPSDRVTLGDPVAKSKYLLIAGGIGITPIRSIAEELSKQGGNAVLLYSARTEQDLVLKNELGKLNITKHYFVTNTGRKIDIGVVQELVPDFAERQVYICGPKPMIESLRDQFQAAGVPKAQIHYELFAY